MQGIEIVLISVIFFRGIENEEKIITCRHYNCFYDYKIFIVVK